MARDKSRTPKGIEEQEEMTGIVYLTDPGHVRFDKRDRLVLKTEKAHLPARLWYQMRK